MRTDLTFHPAWWAAQGFSFERRFFEDSPYRIETDRAMRRVLYDAYGFLGLGDKDPQPRPLVDSDLLAGEFVQGALLGCDVEFFSNQLPYTHAKNCSDEALLALPHFDLDTNPAWIPYRKQYEALLRDYGYVESYLDMHGVQNLALELRGTTLYEDYLCEPALAEKALEAAYSCIDAVATEVLRYTACCSIGVSSILRQFEPTLYLTSNCTCEMVSQTVYDSFLLPFDRKLARHRPFGVHHCGQTMEHLAEAYSRLSPDFIEIGAFSNLQSTLQWFPAQTMVNLRYSPRDLGEKSPVDIRNDVLRMRQQSHGFPMVGISCVGVDATTSAQNIEAFFAAANEPILSNQGERI